MSAIDIPSVDLIPAFDLLGMTVGGFLYGIYFTLFLTSTYLLFARKKAARTTPLCRSAIFVAGCILFITVTSVRLLSVLLTLLKYSGQSYMLIAARVYLAYVVFKKGTAPLEFFFDEPHPTSVAVNAFSLLSIVISDAMIPNLALVVSMTPSFVFTLTTNIYCTGFIFGRIWTISRACKPAQGTGLMGFVAMIVESAAVYTSWALFYMVSHQMNSNSQYIAFAAFPSVAGITNTLIQARVGMGKIIEPPSSTVPTAPLQFAVRSGDGNTVQGTRTVGSGNLDTDHGESLYTGQESRKDVEKGTEL
ncbi:hypothetical protein C8R43DRAFT_1182675 [Mycena crocata]|nr:hypothetical protein C8R43DRAFT_1182675 [Mycena crocata]